MKATTLWHNTTFQNLGGPENGQAVALVNNNIQAVYYERVFVGYQDTLSVNGKQLFFKDCKIYGLAVFQDYKIYIRLRPSNTITITAQSKKSINGNSCLSFQSCDVIVLLGLDHRFNKEGVIVSWFPDRLIFVDVFL